jgi:hypothetical protein
MSRDSRGNRTQEVVGWIPISSLIHQKLTTTAAELFGDFDLHVLEPLRGKQ